VCACVLTAIGTSAHVKRYTYETSSREYIPAAKHIWIIETPTKK